MESLFDARCREALEVARLRHAALGLTISEGTGYGPSVGVAMAHHEGQKEILEVFEAAINGDWPEPEPLPKRLYPPPEPERLTFAETVHRIRDLLGEVGNAPHEEHFGPFCPICGLVGSLRKTMEDWRP